MDSRFRGNDTGVSEKPTKLFGHLALVTPAKAGVQ